MEEEIRQGDTKKHSGGKEVSSGAKNNLARLRGRFYKPDQGIGLFATGKRI